jgi:PQQ enzyme repeat
MRDIIMRGCVRRVRLLTAPLVCLLAVLASSERGAAFTVYTHHYDARRTGWNNQETILTPTNVGSSNFGLIATTPLDEQVDAQPLVIANQQIAGVSGNHTVVYVATENNTVYAIDATTGAILLSRNLGPPVPASSTGNCNNNSRVIGIGSTPVIDTNFATMWVIADTLVNNAPVFYLHALALSTLQDKVPPVVVNASVTLSDGTTQYTFNPTVTRQRSALLHYANAHAVYAGFASYCDFNGSKSRGWLLAWNDSTLAPLPNNWLTDHLATSPNNFFLSSVWMSGSGAASDGSGIFFVTGNSDKSGTTLNVPGNLTESVVKLSMDLSTLKSSFTPANYPHLDAADLDFGAGGILLLPGPLISGHDILATAMGKDGNLYLLNRTALGGFNTTTNAVLDTHTGVGNCHCAESYFVGSDSIPRVVSSGGNKLQTWQVHTSPSPALVADSWTQSIESGQDGGFFTTVSSNGIQNGIIWAVGRPDGTNNNAVYLDAFDANTGNPLVQNMIAGHWVNTGGNANVVPVVTNGKVYVASYKQLAIFGLK